MSSKRLAAWDTGSERDPPTSKHAEFLVRVCALRAAPLGPRPGRNEVAANLLATMAAGRGDVETLNYLIDAGNEVAADRLAEVAAAHGDVDTLNRLADDGSDIAGALLSRIICETE